VTEGVGKVEIEPKEEPPVAQRRHKEQPKMTDAEINDGLSMFIRIEYQCGCINAILKAVKERATP